MKKVNNQKTNLYFLTIVLLLLTSCSKYTGLRTPLYDGQPIKPNEAAIETYRATAEVIDAEKEYYIRYPFSEDILRKSLDYPSEEPFLLEEGRYIIGEDLPAGRASLLGNESSFSTENYDVHVGNLIIRDATGEIYFENLFHSEYGQLTAQLDLISGHAITIIGKEAEITVFYEESLPEKPYVLMDLPDLIENLDRVNVQQPIQILEERGIVYLTAGIYEVGQHLAAGDYVLSNLIAPHHTEMYVFDKSSTPQVIELLMGKPTDLKESQESLKERAKIELKDGEKIYLNLVNRLELIRSEEG